MTDKKAELPDIVINESQFGKRTPSEIDITLSNHRPRMLIDNSVFSSSSRVHRGRREQDKKEESSCCFPFLK